MEKMVKTWGELIDSIYCDSWAPHLLRHRSKYVYRGLPDIDYKLVPSIDRIGKHSNAADVERLLLSDFRQFAQSHVSPGESMWNWLALAQHHGLPTRFLDWTYSPFVALHFATANLGQDPPKSDAALWCVNYHETNKRLPFKLKQKQKEYSKQVFSVETLDMVVQNLAELDALSETSFLFFLEPPSLDARIVNQAALFSVMSRPEYLNKNARPISLDQYLEDEEKANVSPQASLFRKIIIPAALKWEIRDHLDQANVSERIIYPGLDGLSAWLKRHYTRKARPDETDH